MTVSFLKSRSEMSPVQRLHADAREDYTEHQKPEVAAAAREQRGQGIADAQAHGSHGRRK